MRATVDETELTELVQQLRDGDNSVSESIIIHFLGLARSLSRHAVIRHPHKTDDIRAAAIFGLVQAVRWAPLRMYDNRIGPYITTTVRRFIREFLERDHIIRVPKDEWAKMVERLNLEELNDYEREKALRELKIIQHVFQTCDYGDDYSSGDGDFIGSRAFVFDEETIIVEDMKRYLKLTYFERCVLDFRMQGYTLKEVGAKLSKSDVAIHNTLKKLQLRYRIIQRAHPTLPEPPDGI